MTNEELFADLKQFIEATVSQQMAHVATKDDVDRLDGKVDSIRSELTAEIRDVRSDLRLLDEKLDTIHDAIADTVQDHERRLGRLEQRTA